MDTFAGIATAFKILKEFLLERLDSVFEGGPYGEGEDGDYITPIELRVVGGCLYLEDPNAPCNGATVLHTFQTRDEVYEMWDSDGSCDLDAMEKLVDQILHCMLNGELTTGDKS